MISATRNNFPLALASVNASAALGGWIILRPYKGEKDRHSQEGRLVPHRYRYIRLKDPPFFSLQDVGARRAPADWGRPFAAHAALQAGQHHLQPARPYEPLRHLGGRPILAQLRAEVCEKGGSGGAMTCRFLRWL